MDRLLPMLSSMVTAIPVVLVEVGLLALAILRWREHPRVSMLATTSAVLLLTGDLLLRPLFVVLPMRAREAGESVAEMSWILGLLGVVSSLLHAVALGLLVAAVFVDRRPVTSTGREVSR